MDYLANHAGGEDFLLDNLTIVFQPNETTQNVSIELVSDGVLEPTEQFAVFLIAGEGVAVTRGEATVYILDG